MTPRWQIKPASSTALRSSRSVRARSRCRCNAVRGVLERSGRRSAFPFAPLSRSPPGRLQGAAFPRRSFLAPQSRRHRRPFGSRGRPFGSRGRPFGSRDYYTAAARSPDISWVGRGPRRIGVPLVRAGPAGSGSSRAMPTSTRVSWSMSIPPGPRLSHSGTWEAP
jgi:hypothetical protein